MDILRKRKFEWKNFEREISKVKLGLNFFYWYFIVIVYFSESSGLEKKFVDMYWVFLF